MKRLAVGRTAGIYVWDGGHVVKLFAPSYSRQRVEVEANVNRAVHAAGLPAPAVGDVVEVDGRWGIVFERVEGPSMLSAMERRPWTLPKFADLLARLQADIHSAAPIDSLPSLKERLQSGIRRLTVPENWEAVRAGILNRLDSLPDGTNICHGDFHPGNVILSSRGPLIIDWVDASRGPAVADVARTVLLGRVAIIPQDVPGRRVLNAGRRWFLARYLACYRRLRGVDQAQVEPWVPVLAAARIGENIPEEEPRLLALAREVL